jgi:hypothetical protein
MHANEQGKPGSELPDVQEPLLRANLCAEAGTFFVA